MSLKKLILCNASGMWFAPIADRIEFLKLPFEVIDAINAEEALSSVPDEEHCVIITEILIPGQSFGKQAGAALNLAEKARQKNSKCYVILFTLSTSFLREGDEKKFNRVIDSTKRDSLELLFVKLNQLSKGIWTA